MLDYVEPIFSVPLFHFKVEDWNNKKKTLLEIVNNKELHYERGNFVYTDYIEEDGVFPSSDVDPIVNELINEEVNRFSRYAQVDLLPMNYWFEKSLKNDHHLVHNHGGTGFSAVMFIEYDERVHKPTGLLSPISPWLKKLESGNVVFPENIKSGSIIYFPSFINHFTIPNESEKERIILSWNIVEK